MLVSLKNLPKNVLVMALASFLMNISSSMISSSISVFLNVVLGSSISYIAIIRGFSEGLGHIMKAFSGIISDKIRKRKPLVLIGYGMMIFIKPLFAVASNLWVYAIAQISDRLLNGVRDTSRDALIADSCHKSQLNIAFGFRQAAANVGSILGPFLTSMLLIWSSNNFRLTYWLAIVPIIFTTLVIIFALQDPYAKGSSNLPLVAPNTRLDSPLNTTGNINHSRTVEHINVSNNYDFKQKLLLLKQVPGFWAILIIYTVYALSRSSEALLQICGQYNGFDITQIPLIISGLYASKTLASLLIAGIMFYIGNFSAIILSILLGVVANALLATPQQNLFLLGTLLLGASNTFMDIIAVSCIAKEVPKSLRATSYGILGCCYGFTTFSSNYFISLLVGEDKAALYLAYVWGLLFTSLALLVSSCLYKYLAQGRNLQKLRS